MAKNVIKKKVDQARVKIEQQQQLIRELQDQCPHPDAIRQYRADTGNYDPAWDQYWIDFTCPDCQKHWTEPQ